jgi:rhodanese-related sulfurtransferase
LIQNTISEQSEEKIINEYLNKYDFTPKFVIYGKNANDNSVEVKAKQLSGLGFSDVYLYIGGIFEWLLLKDVYGDDEFPTTSKFLDILFYKAKPAL